jgi:hypothetical protein
MLTPFRYHWQHTNNLPYIKKGQGKEIGIDKIILPWGFTIGRFGLV